MFLLGAKPLGPRGPRALFYMLPKHYRVQGLCTALSFKYAQNNLHIVDSLEIPTDDPEVENNEISDMRCICFEIILLVRSFVMIYRVLAHISKSYSIIQSTLPFVRNPFISKFSRISGSNVQYSIYCTSDKFILKNRKLCRLLSY